MSASTKDTVASETLAEKLQTKLRSHGFEPGESVHDFSPSFTKEDAQRSLFESTHSEPIPVFVSSPESDVRLRVVLTRAEPRYRAFVGHPEDTPSLTHESPDWYFEGWVMKSGFDCFEPVVRVRIFMEYGFTELSDSMLWQVIPKAGAANGVINLVEG